MIAKDICIPGYDLEEILGKGGAAVVYRARQKSFGREVALKVLNPDSEDAEAFSQRFLCESKIVANLHHSHIVQVYDVGQHENYCYISMEYLQPADLSKRIKAGITLKETVTLIKQVASALDFAHRKHIVHRDIKPENILFREDNAAVLTDFGIAKELQNQSGLTQTGLVIGTPKYMSPEQIRGEAVDHRADLYALGVVFFRCLTNFLPFIGKDVLATAYLQNHEPVPNLPLQVACFQVIVHRMLEKQPEDRFQRGNEIITALEALDNGAYNGELTNLEVAAANQHSPPTVTRVPSGSRVATGQITVVPSPPNVKKIKYTEDETLFHARPNAVGTSEKTVMRHRIEPSISEQIYPSDYLDAPDLDDLDAEDTQSGEAEHFESRPILTVGRIVGMLTVIAAVVVLVTNPLTGKSAKSTWPEYFSSLQRNVSDLLGLLPESSELNPLVSKAGELDAEKPRPDEPRRIEGAIEVADAPTSIGEPSTDAETPEAITLHSNAKEIEIANKRAVEGLMEMPNANQDAAFEDELILEPEPVVATPTQEDVIANYLSEAETDLANNRLREPLESNAFDKYQKVLALDPINSVAKEGVRKISQTFLIRANSAIGAKNFDAAKSLIAEAHATLPENPDIQNTRIKLVEARAAERERIAIEEAKAIEQKIAKLMQAAERDEQAGRVRTPLGNNALEKYQRILELDPDNAIAIKKLIEFGR